MEQKNEQNTPLHIKNLAELKRCIRPGTELVATSHIVTPELISFPANQDFRDVEGKINFLGEEITLAEFCRQHGLKAPPRYKLRPASPEEAGLFYSDLEETADKKLGTVGHVRMDFGSSGKGFHHSWWPHNGDRFNSDEFKGELQEVVDTFRADGPLKDLIAAAVQIADNLDDYLLESDQRNPEEVGIDELRFIVDERSRPILQKHVALYNYGQDVMAAHNALLTPYGLVQRRDGEPIRSEETQAENAGMEMM